MCSCHLNLLFLNRKGLRHSVVQFKMVIQYIFQRTLLNNTFCLLFLNGKHGGVATETMDRFLTNQSVLVCLPCWRLTSMRIRYRLEVKRLLDRLVFLFCFFPSSVNISTVMNFPIKVC